MGRVTRSLLVRLVIPMGVLSRGRLCQGPAAWRYSDLGHPVPLSKVLLSVPVFAGDIGMNACFTASVSSFRLDTPQFLCSALFGVLA